MRAAPAPRPPRTPRTPGEPSRAVSFPDEPHLLASYLDPNDPWAHVEETTGDELSVAYEESCRKHRTVPLECILNQLKEMKFVNGSSRQGTLTLTGCILTPTACETLEAILKKVRFQRIDVHDCQLNDDAAVALFDMVEYYESTAELDISGNKNFGIQGWQACSKMVNKSQWLEQLELRDTSLSESYAPVLGRGLRPACSLRSLHLQRSHLTGAPLLCLAGYLKQNKSVRELHIGDNQLVASDAKHLASMLKSNSSLQLLDISNNDIQDSGIEAIADALEEQSSVQSSSSSSSSDSPLSSPQSSSSGSVQDRGLAVLIVWNNNLTRNSGKHFSKALARCRSLEVLNIGQNPLCGEAVNRFRNALQQNRTLLSLGMQSTKLCAEAAIALAEVIEDNPVIQRIDLRDNKLQTAGLLALATALKKNHTVTRIDLDDAPPSQVIISEKDQPLEETRLVTEIRSLCKRNETGLNPSNLLTDDDDSTSLQRRRAASFATRKISLTCQTLHTHPEPVLSPPKTPTGRLRSPSPSPIPSPASSPIPSPSHRSRFHVSRVSDSSSVSSQSPSPSTPPGSKSFFPGNSRFRVVSVQEPPSISVHSPDETAVNVSKPNVDASDTTKSEKFVKYQNSRFLIKRNVELGEREIVKQPSTNIVVPVPHKNNESSLDNSEKTSDSNIKDSNNAYNTKFPNKDEVLPFEENGQKKTFNIIKKNKSESSLDSPDLEVSRLMHNQGKKSNYDSSSSLDISGSSMESLNTLEMNIDLKIRNENVPLNKEPVKQVLSVEFSLDSEENDVFSEIKVPQKLSNLSSSNESSLDLSAPVEVPHGNIFHFSNQSFLNSSVSSNESVSPNIFGKHMKLHGSVTSLEASVSSLDSFKSSCNTLISPGLVESTPQNFPTPNKNLVDSTDSGIFQSDNSPRAANDSISSNEGTLTDNSNLSKMIKSIGSSLELHSKVPERTASLLDVPSSSSKQRVRKISWVSPTPQRKDSDEAAQAAKGPSSLEKLLNIFQISGNLFSRGSFDTSDKKSDVQNIQRRDSSSNITGSFWPWSLGSTSASSSKSQATKCEGDKNVNRVTSSVSAEYTVKLDKKSVQDDPLTANTTKTQVDSFTNDKVMAASASLGTVGSIQPESTVGGSVPAICLEHGVLCCDNVDDIEAEDPEIIYSDICDSVSTSTEGIQSELDRDDTDADIANCDSVMVQSTIDANINVTTLSLVEDDNINAKDEVQNNLLVLSACDINLEPDGSQLICDLNSETGDCLFTKSSKIVDAPLKVEDNIQVIDLEMDSCDALTISNVSQYGNEEVLNDKFSDDITISREEIITISDLPTLENVIVAKQTDLISDDDSIDISIHQTDETPLSNIVEDKPLKENSDLIKTKEMSDLIEEHLKECSDFTSYSKENRDTDDVGEYPKIEIDKKIHDDNFTDIIPSSVLKQSIGLENKTSSDKQLSPESGPSIDNLPSKIIKRIKENISPENTLTSSMSNTQALVLELAERRKTDPTDFNKEKIVGCEDVKNIENQRFVDNENVDKPLNMMIIENENRQEAAVESYFTSENLKNENILNQHFMATLVITENFEESPFEPTPKISCDEIEDVKIITDENTQFDTKSENINVSVDQAIEEAKDVLNEIEQNVDESKSYDVTEVSALNQNSCITNVDDKSVAIKHNIKPVSILKRSSNERKHCSLPRNIPEQNKKDNEKHTPIRCGSLPESMSSYSPKSDLTSRSKIGKSRSPINTLGKMARDSLYALNMSDDDITELAHSKRLSSLESVRSLGSVSEDAGDIFPLRKVLSSSESRSLGPCASQESLASLASITEMVAEGGAPTTDAPKNDDRV